MPKRPKYYDPLPERARPEPIDCDICIYGGTSGGVAAAVCAARQGLKPVIVNPSFLVGGLSASGLGWTDFGRDKGAAVGGISWEFYQQVGVHYGVEYESKFEPSVARKVFDAWVAEHGIAVYPREFLDSVVMDGTRIHKLVTESGLEVSARIFFDCSYEGDLMAAAGVSWTAGREGTSVYGESLNGVQVRPTHQFDVPVDPWVREGDPSSGLLPGVNPELDPPEGEGDKRIQAYNFRLCMTTNPDNRVPFYKPDDYNPMEYELLARAFKAGFRDVFAKHDHFLYNQKTDTNNHGCVSTDFIGRNHEWPTASYQRREEIFQEHVGYTQGLLWFYCNDERVPPEIAERYRTYGYCADEFPETDGFSPQIYVREARRMVSDFVMTQSQCSASEWQDDSVGLASYNMDSHNCQRFARDGRVFNEGDVQVAPEKPYPISYRTIVPKRGECPNLMVPVCLSASHIAFGSIRMEPVFMILGESAAIAAGLALEKGYDLQDVPYEELKPRLEAAGQKLFHQ